MSSLYHGSRLRPPLYQDRLLRLFLYQDGHLRSRLPFLSMFGGFSSTHHNQPLQLTGTLVAAEDPSGNLRRRSSLRLWGGGAMCWLLVGKGESGQFRPNRARLNWVWICYLWRRRLKVEWTEIDEGGIGRRTRQITMMNLTGMVEAGDGTER